MAELKKSGAAFVASRRSGFLLDVGGGTEEYVYPDEDGFTIETHTPQPVLDAIFDRNAEMRNTRGIEIAKGDGAFHHVASIPREVYEQWIREDPEVQYSQSKLLARIRDRDFSKVRTSERI